VSTAPEAEEKKDNKSKRNAYNRVFNYIKNNNNNNNT
jgi:hypothetical protein